MLSKEELFNLKITSPDEGVFRKVKKNWDAISKPVDGLGDFEELLCRVAAIQRRCDPKVSKRAAIVMCADNGVTAEGISQSGSEITLAVARALGRGISSACTLGKAAHVQVIPVDIGIDCDEKIEGVLHRKVRRGTGNIAAEPAMTEEDELKAICCGIDMVKVLSGKGFNMVALGEMGIGNTTTATAVISACLGIDSNLITGRGAGLDDERFDRKKRVIKQALSMTDFGGITDVKERAFAILRMVGGLDIAGLAGVIAGGAICHMPIVLDGLISLSAAVVAEMMIPGVSAYMIPSHKGKERGTMYALDYLGLFPFINGNMKLGEGTGAIMLFPLIDLVSGFYQNGAKFSDYKIDEYERFV